MASLIWVFTVCKGYQQMILVGKDLMLAKNIPTSRPLAKSALQKYIFLISQPKHVLWVLKKNRLNETAL